MTFEEFFIKKRIDLAQLKAAEPDLFSEFKSHFELMGEKSFDQVKKFWFNKLRRTYHLKEAPKPAKEVIEKTRIASQAEPLSSPSLDQKPEDFPASQPVAPDTAEAADQTEGPSKPAIKPKFTPRNIPSKPKGTVIGEVPEDTVSKEEASKPAASYKPKFNSKNIKPKEEFAESSSVPPESTGAESAGPTEAKPAYKPKFTLKNINAKKKSGIDIPASAPEKTSEEADPQNSSTPTEAENKETKPAFKPRFNMKNIKPKEESEIEVPASAPEIIEVPKEDSSSATPEEVENQVTKPAYKPRFNMKNIKPKEESGIDIPASAEKISGERGPQEPAEPEEAEKKETKPAYKPRFNMKNIKPKSEE